MARSSRFRSGWVAMSSGRPASAAWRPVGSHTTAPACPGCARVVLNINTSNSAADPAATLRQVRRIGFPSLAVAMARYSKHRLRRPGGVVAFAPSMIDPFWEGLGVQILVADDMPMVRRLCSSILRGAGHRVIEVEDGQAALTEYAEHRPDALLLDLRMPNMDGLAVLRELKTLDPGAHVVIVTAGTDAEIREAVE